MPDHSEFDPSPWLATSADDDQTPDLSAAQVRRLGSRRRLRRYLGTGAATVAFVLVAGMGTYGLTKGAITPDVAAAPSPTRTSALSTTTPSPQPSDEVGNPPHPDPSYPTPPPSRLTAANVATSDDLGAVRGQRFGTLGPASPGLGNAAEFTVCVRAPLLATLQTPALYRVFSWGAGAVQATAIAIETTDEGAATTLVSQLTDATQNCVTTLTTSGVSKAALVETATPTVPGATEAHYSAVTWANPKDPTSPMWEQTLVVRVKDRVAIVTYYVQDGSAQPSKDPVLAAAPAIAARLA